MPPPRRAAEVSLLTSNTRDFEIRERRFTIKTPAAVKTERSPDIQKLTLERNEVIFPATIPYNIAVLFSAWR